MLNRLFATNYVALLSKEKLTLSCNALQLKVVLEQLWSCSSSFLYANEGAALNFRSRAALKIKEELLLRCRWGVRFFLPYKAK